MCGEIVSVEMRRSPGHVDCLTPSLARRRSSSISHVASFRHAIAAREATLLYRLLSNARENEAYPVFWMRVAPVHSV